MDFYVFLHSVFGFHENSNAVFGFSFLTPLKVKMLGFSVLLPFFVSFSVLEVFSSGFAVSQRPQCPPPYGIVSPTSKNSGEL